MLPREFHDLRRPIAVDYVLPAIDPSILESGGKLLESIGSPLFKLLVKGGEFLKWSVLNGLDRVDYRHAAAALLSEIHGQLYGGRVQIREIGWQENVLKHRDILAQ